MPITAGEHLGPFVIRAPLDKGGAGRVYLAFDPRLGREVAIKLLPDGAIGSAERRTRFIQEAKLASALNHPNIAAIYDLNTAEVNGKLVDFVVLEYVHGKTLDQLIGRKGLRLSEALRYARQIADGLAAAHGAGIVHGDLKPANIVVNEQGEIKILDLGLARLIQRDPADAWALTESVHFETAAGALGGSAGYMSPEQAEGQSVDQRSDVFSFGAVLCEMIAGRRAFSGAHAISAPISEARDKIPREVESILQRCLERCLRKDPRRRWQSVTSLKFALEDASEEWDRSQTALGQEASRAWTRGRALPLLAWLALTVLALAAGGYIGARSLTRPHATFQRLTFRRGDISGAKFSPDGHTVLFSAQWAGEPTAIFSTRLGRGESRPLGLPTGRNISISSSGELAILLGSATSGTQGTLARVPLSGGAPREILENVNDADWSPDGTSLAVSHSIGGHNRIEYPIGTVLQQSDGRPPLSLRVSPQGDALAFFEYDNAIGDYAVTVLYVHGGKRVLSRGWRSEGGLAWSPKGDEIWYSGGKSGGEPVLRAVKINSNDRIVVEAPAWIALKDIASGGRVLASVVDTRLGISGLTAGAKQERDLSWFEASRIYDISADGSMILFVELTYGQSRNPAIYLRKTDGSPAVRLGDGNRPALSPDGKWVACIVSDGPRTWLTLLPTGAGQARTIGTSGMHYERVEWFPDGQRILFLGNQPNRPARAFAQEVNGGEALPLTPEGMDASHVSPDQKYAIVIASAKVSLFPIRGGSPMPIASLEPGESVIRWSGDGRFLFLRKLEEPTLLKINRLDVSTGRKELWRELRAPDPVGVQILQVVLTPDGNSYAYSFQRDISTLYLAEGLR